MNSIVQKCCLIHTVGINKKVLLAALFIALSLPVFSQVGIGTTTPNAASMLDLTATNKGLLLPRLANTSVIASPTNGLVIYDESEECVKTYQNNAWSNCLGVTIPPKVETLTCGTATTVGVLTAGTIASGVSFTVNYTGGNGAVYAGETIASTGVTGLTAVLAGGILATGNGTVTYTISGTPNGVSSGTASFAITVGGQSCTVNVTVLEAVPTITGLDCSGATTVGSLVAGTAASGVSFTVNYSGGNGVAYTEATVNSTSVTGLTATLAAGTLAAGSGSLTYTVSGTPSGVLPGTTSFEISIGGQLCTVNIPVLGAEPTITTLDCAGATIVGDLTAGTAASGVTFTVEYTGGNGANYTGETVNSTGITGLTATLVAGTLATGSASITYTVSGTPNGRLPGTASFAISIGGQSCSVSYCVSGISVATTIVEITSPSNQVWMDRNLGAENVGDAGDYYQWGRADDGHQFAESCTKVGPVADGAEGTSYISDTGSEWLITSDDLRWNSGTEENPVKTEHDPCPSGYRIPTKTELFLELSNTSSLNFPYSGYRISSGLTSVGARGLYWSSSSTSITGSGSLSMYYGSSPYASQNSRSIALSIRCIKE